MTAVTLATLGDLSEKYRLYGVCNTCQDMRLPPECVRVLAAEYVEGGTCRARFHATGFPRSTYYRTLDQAHQALMPRFDTLEGCSPSGEF